MGRGLWLAQLVVGAASATNGFGFNHSDSRVNPLLPKLPPQSGHDKARRWAALRLATTYGLTAACGTSQRVGWCRGTRPNKDAEQVDLTPLLFLFQRDVAQDFRVCCRDAQQGPGRAGRLASSLLPILQGAHRDTQQGRELPLRKSDAGACLCCR